MVTSVGIAAGIAVALSATAEPPKPQVLRGTRAALTSTNTLYGPTGLINTPTAFVTPHQVVQFGATFAQGIRGPSANWGITPGVEVGGAYIDRDGALDKGIANAKVNIIPQNFEWFEVGVGIIDAVDALGQTFYAVGSADLVVPDPLKDRAVGLRVHAGVGTGMFKEKLFGGGELTLDDRFSIIGEWDAKNFNGAIRYSHPDGFRFQVGFRHTDAFVGATYGLKF